MAEVTQWLTVPTHCQAAQHRGAPYLLQLLLKFSAICSTAHTRLAPSDLLVPKEAAPAHAVCCMGTGLGGEGGNGQTTLARLLDTT